MRCAFGDAGLTSLYMTAGDGGLYRAGTDAAGCNADLLFRCGRQFLRGKSWAGPKLRCGFSWRSWREFCLLGAAAIPDASAQVSNQADTDHRVEPPASGPDIIGRLIGQKFTEAWGQQVIVDTRPGASGIIGAEIASKAAPDGHTLMIVTSQAVIVSVMYEKLPYRLLKDFSPISMLASTPFILAVHPAVPASSIRNWWLTRSRRPGSCATDPAVQARRRICPRRYSNA